MIINGKEYPLWSQFVERQNEWIGGILEDEDMGECTKTTITGIELRENGKDSAFFAVTGKDFECGFDVRHGGIGQGDRAGRGWLTFYGYGGHTWRIKQCKNKKKNMNNMDLSGKRK